MHCGSSFVCAAVVGWDNAGWKNVGSSSSLENEVLEGDRLMVGGMEGLGKAEEDIKLVVPADNGGGVKDDLSPEVSKTSSKCIDWH
jgi:hypothetical protein